MSFSFLRTGQCSGWLRPKMQTYEECGSATVGYGQRLQEWAQIQCSVYWLRQTTLECRLHVTCVLNVKEVQSRFNWNWRSGRATLTVSHSKNSGRAPISFTVPISGQYFAWRMRQLLPWKVGNRLSKLRGGRPHKTSLDIHRHANSKSLSLSRFMIIIDTGYSVA